MNKAIVGHIALFFVLILLQVVVFNSMFLGNYVPYMYVLFVLLYPIKSNKILFLASSFLLGLSLDFFLSSGGVHAAACTLIAYVRPLVLKFSFGISYEYQTIKIAEATIKERIAYFSLLILTHHTVLFVLEIYSTSLLLYGLKTILLTTIYSTVICLLLVALFRKQSP